MICKGGLRFRVHQATEGPPIKVIARSARVHTELSPTAPRTVTAPVAMLRSCFRSAQPSSTSLARLLATHKQEALTRGFAKPTDFVFCSLTGGPLNHRNIARRGLDEALATAQLPTLTWHDLRHVAASALIGEGASVAYISRLLGHANPAITLSIYAHEFARAEHAERTRERMEEAFGRLLE